MYNLRKTALDFAAQADKIGTSMHKVCQRAKFSYATYLSWKHGHITDAKLSSVDRIHVTLEKMKSEYLHLQEEERAKK